MDTSEQYIKMCEKAEEIQALAPELQVGDVYAYLRSKSGSYWITKSSDIPEVRVIDTGYNEEVGHFYIDDIEHCWLPRQDQLQEIIQATFETLERFTNWWQSLPYLAMWEGVSYEQLWLAFVMKERWQKVWVNEDWIKEHA